MMCATGFGDGGFRIKAGVDSSSLKAPFTETDITYEGVFAEYYFDTAIAKIRDEPGASEMKSGAVMMPDGGPKHADASAIDADCKEDSTEEPLFWIRPSFAVCQSPMSGETQQYLALGLHCKYDGSGIKKHGRPPLALSVVIDVSYSMHEPFKGSTGEGDWRTRTKLEICKRSVVSMLRHLRTDSDWLCVSIFDQGSKVLIPLTRWKLLNAEEVKSTIMAITPGGSTNLALGFRTGAEPLTVIKPSDEDISKAKSAKEFPTQKRVMFFTDMQPTMGEVRSEGLFGIADDYASKQIYTTFVGVGLDFGSELANHITTNLKGAHYLTVTSEQDFADLMDVNFDYSVFPIINDLEMQLLGGSSLIDEVYGTRERTLSTATMMKAKTIFPGDCNEEGHAKGAVLLVRLKDLKASGGDGSGASDEASDKQFRISLSYENFMTGVKHTEDGILIDIPASLFASEGDGRGQYESGGIRKAILLAEYVSVCQKLVSKDGLDDSVYAEKKGTVDTGEESVTAGDTTTTDDGSTDGSESDEKEKEKKRKLRIDVEYAEKFQAWFEKEADEIGDDNLKKELDVIKSVVEWKKKVLEYKPPAKKPGRRGMMGARILG